MDKLAHVSADALRETLADVSTGKAAKRLIVALAYKDGVPVSTLSDRYEIPRSTIYYWLDRFESMSIEAAIEDDDRPGRPPALDPDDREALRADLARAPRASGFDADSWSSELVRAHLAEQYDVEYSLGHVRRLLRISDIEVA